MISRKLTLFLEMKLLNLTHYENEIKKITAVLENMYLDYIYSSQFPFKYLNIEFCPQRDVDVKFLILEFS